MNGCLRTAVLRAWDGGGARLRHWELSEVGERLGSRGKKFNQNPMGKEELLGKEVVESAREAGAGDTAVGLGLCLRQESGDGEEGAAG